MLRSRRAGLAGRRRCSSSRAATGRSARRRSAAQLGVDWHSLGDGFTWDSDQPRPRQGPRPQAWIARPPSDRRRRAPPRHPRRADLPVHVGLDRHRRGRRRAARPARARQRHRHRPRRAGRAHRDRRHRHRDAQGQARVRPRHRRQARHRLLRWASSRLLIGGARSGKSGARRRDRPPPRRRRRSFIATAEPFDDDLRDRIARPSRRSARLADDRGAARPRRGDRCRARRTTC